MSDMKNRISIYLLLKRILVELNAQVVEHGERVAFLELKMAQFRGQKDDRHLENMMLTCFAHDIGAYKTEKFLSLLAFDAANTLEHCIYGYLFMKYFSPLKEDSEVFLYHHSYYEEKSRIDSPFFDDGTLIHMLDRVDVLHISCTQEEVISQLRSNSGTIFNPDDVRDFIALNEKENVIGSLVDGSYADEVRAYFDNGNRNERLLEPIVNMLAYEVDFKSEQTVIHTVTTALISKCIGSGFGLTEKENDEIFMAAKLHDLGKIKIPTAILEKPGRLTPEEYSIIKNHCLYTGNIIGELFPDEIVSIACHHHERLDGSGYPNGLCASQLTIQDRILQVADVASALVYKRSYKDAMEKKKVIAILTEEKENGKLDGEAIDMFVSNYDRIMEYTTEHSGPIISKYEKLQNEYRDYLRKYADLNHETEIGTFSIGGVKVSIPGRM